MKYRKKKKQKPQADMSVGVCTQVDASASEFRHVQSPDRLPWVVRPHATWTASSIPVRVSFALIST